MRLAAKIDANQQTIVVELRKIPGITVAITSAVGDGFPDLCVGYGGVNNYLFELKDPAKPPSKQKLTSAQEEFHAKWCGQVATVRTLDEILIVLGISRREVQRAWFERYIGAVK